MDESNRAEDALERLLLAARWLLVPMYAGLVLALVMLALVFLREVIGTIPVVFTMPTEAAIPVVLTLIELTLAGHLLLIVLFAGFETFVTKVQPTQERGAGLGAVDVSGLRVKLIASIAAIAAVHLLKRFLELGSDAATTSGEATLFWPALVFAVFVAAGVLTGLIDWLTGRADRS